MTDNELSDFTLRLITDGYAEIAGRLITALESHSVPFHHFLNGIGQYYHDEKGLETVAYHVFEAARILSQG